MGDVGRTEHKMIQNLSEVDTAAEVEGLAQQIALATGRPISEVLADMVGQLSTKTVDAARVQTNSSTGQIDEGATADSIASAIRSGQLTPTEKLKFEYTVYIAAADLPHLMPPRGTEDGTYTSTNAWLFKAAFLTILSMYYQDIASIESKMAKVQGLLAAKLMSAIKEQGELAADLTMQAAQMQAAIAITAACTAALSAGTSFYGASKIMGANAASQAMTQKELDNPNQTAWAQQTNGYKNQSTATDAKITKAQGELDAKNQDGSYVLQGADRTAKESEIAGHQRTKAGYDEKYNEAIGKRNSENHQTITGYHQAMTQGFNSMFQMMDKSMEAAFIMSKGFAEAALQITQAAKELLSTGLSSAQSAKQEAIKNAESTTNAITSAAQQDAQTYRI